MNRRYLWYFLNFCWKAWFWHPIWVLFYLLFTNYTGIGVLETIMIVTATLAEIPTGAIADIFGKKPVIVMAFLFAVIGDLIMGFAPSFIFLCISILFLVIGSALFSGTMEALIFDSLADSQEEGQFQKVIANVKSYQLIAFASTAIVGGFLYLISPGFPFFITAALAFVGLVGSFFLKEPTRDTQKFSFTNYIQQNKEGFKSLFSTPEKRRISLALLSVMCISIICYEMLNDVLAVEFGFSAQQLGVLITIIYLASAFFSQFSPYLMKKLGLMRSFLCIAILFAAMLVLAKFTSSLIAAGILLSLISSVISMFENIVSVQINAFTQSAQRATTLSTFALLQNIPYVCMALFIGKVMDKYSGRSFAFFLGIVVFGILAVQLRTFLFTTGKKQAHENAFAKSDSISS